MNRDYILDLIKTKAADIIPNFDPNEVDASRSLQDYGASSLDLVELVSVTMRELKVKVPRSELGKISNLDGLVDLFDKAVRERSLK